MLLLIIFWVWEHIGRLYNWYTPTYVMSWAGLYLNIFFYNIGKIFAKIINLLIYINLDEIYITIYQLFIRFRNLLESPVWIIKGYNENISNIDTTYYHYILICFVSLFITILYEYNQLTYVLFIIGMVFGIERIIYHNDILY